MELLISAHWFSILVLFNFTNTNQLKINAIALMLSKMFDFREHFYPPAKWDTKQGSNTIMSTWFALKFGSDKIIDIDIILSFTLTAR